MVKAFDESASERVDRLVAFCKRRRIHLDEKGDVSPALLAEAMQEKGYKGSYEYWRDILAKEHRSFGASKARQVELALEMSYLYLEGGADWPFDSIEIQKILALSDRDLARLEGAILVVAQQLGLDIAAADDSAPSFAQNRK